MAQATYPPVPDTARVDLLGRLGSAFGGIEVQTSFYVRNLSATRNNAYLVALGEAFCDEWDGTGAMASIMNGTYTLVTVRVTDLDTALRPSVDVPCGKFSSLGTSAILPATIAAVVRLPGQAGGVPKKSYVRHIAPFENEVDGNTVSSTPRTNIANAYRTYIVAATSVIAGDAPALVSVFEPNGVAPNVYRDSGLTNLIDTAQISVRELIGRAVSRQT